MRLLLVINGLGTGGAERSTAELLPRLVEAGITPTVACLLRRGEGVQTTVEEDVDVRFLRPGGTVSRVRQLHRLIGEVRPDLVHTMIFEADIAGRLAAVGGPPVLASLVNVAYDPVRLTDPNVTAWRLRSAQAVERVTAPLVTHFHAISQTVKDSAVAGLGIRPERITVVPRGRDPQRLGEPSPERRARARETLGLAADDEVLITVGRQEFQKGQRHLLEAVALLAASRPRLVLLLAGREGHATAELRALVASGGLTDRVRFLGHRDDVPELLAAADVFVFPSLYEGLGGSLLEAMALALPAVLSDLPAFGEVAVKGETAVFVPPADACSLADAVWTLLEHPVRGQAMGQRARERFLERFTEERSSKGMVTLYRSLAG